MSMYKETSNFHKIFTEYLVGQAVSRDFDDEFVSFLQDKIPELVAEVIGVLDKHEEQWGEEYVYQMVNQIKKEQE